MISFQWWGFVTEGEKKKKNTQHLRINTSLFSSGRKVTTGSRMAKINAAGFNVLFPGWSSAGGRKCCLLEGSGSIRSYGCMSKCPWARCSTPNFSWWLVWGWERLSIQKENAPDEHVSTLHGSLWYLYECVWMCSQFIIWIYFNALQLWAASPVFVKCSVRRYCRSAADQKSKVDLLWVCFTV